GDVLRSSQRRWWVAPRRSSSAAVVRPPASPTSLSGTGPVSAYRASSAISIPVGNSSFNGDSNHCEGYSAALRESKQPNRADHSCAGWSTRASVFFTGSSLPPATPNSLAAFLPATRITTSANCSLDFVVI